MKNERYQKIVWAVAQRGACLDGITYMLSHTDFEEMFYGIPDPSWVGWLVDRFKIIHPISRSASKNLCLNLGRGMRKALFADRGLGLTRNDKRTYDGIVEGPWGQKLGVRGDAYYIGELLYFFLEAITEADALDAIVAADRIVSSGNTASRAAFALELKEALRNFDSSVFERVIARTTFTTRRTRGNVSWRWDREAGVVRRTQYGM